MNFYGFDESKAVANCSSQSRGRYQPRVTAFRAWQRLGPEHIVGLLGDAALPARAQARLLAGLLEQMSWRLLAIGHDGGKGDARGTEHGPQLTLSVAGRTYHLHCKQAPFLHVTQITV